MAIKHVIPLLVVLTAWSPGLALASDSPATTQASGAASAALLPQDMPLTSAAAIRRLTPAQAATAQPVKLRGVITYLSTVAPLFFIQDETGGICVSGPWDREVRSQMKIGVTIEVQGVTAPGRLVPYITGRQKEPVKIVVAEPILAPKAISIPIVQLASPELHGNLVEADGVVRNARVETLSGSAQEVLILTFGSGRERVEAAFLGWHPNTPAPNQMVGAEVRIRGVFNSSTGEKQPLAMMKLLFQSMKELRIIDAAKAPFELPVTDIRALNAAEEGTTPRVRVQGVVTLPVADKGLFVQGSDGGIWVESPPAAARQGDSIDVVGFPARRGWAIILEDAVLRIGKQTPLPTAPLVTPEQALTGDLNATRVRMEAVVLGVSRLSEGPTMVLQSGDRVFLARVAALGGAPLSSVAEGSWVSVTGVCVNNRLPEARDAAPPAAESSRPISFHILLASSGAVDVIRAPIWWTLRRTLIAFGSLAAIVVAAFTWVLALRRRVARQTTLIRDHLAKETLYEERVRIARELHDSLEQDLLGITMQLNATEKLLATPDRARNSLQLAAAMVRRSQAETHRAVWDLRERRSGDDGLVVTLREAVAGLTPGAQPLVNIEVSGEARALSAQMENHLLRVAIEAITNAMKHAQASHITVQLAYEPRQIGLRVSDDGCGFDAMNSPPPTSGHFGLFGMRERAEKLKGDLSIRSRPGQGAEIRLIVPDHGSSVSTSQRTPRDPIRLMIVDDHFVVRIGLQSALNLEPDMEVVAEAKDGKEAVSVYAKHRPDVVVMDYQLPELNGAEATAAICARFPDARIIVLSVFKGEEDVHRAVQAGAVGYLPKSSEPGELLDAIRTIYNGGRYFPPAIDAALASRASRGVLSEREKEVLAMIVRGRSNKEIAIELGISENTVKVHTTRVFEKLGVADRLEAMSEAIRRGIVHIQE